MKDNLKRKTVSNKGITFPKELNIYEHKTVIDESVLKNIELFISIIYQRIFDYNYDIPINFRVRAGLAYRAISERMDFSKAIEILADFEEIYKERYFEHLREEDLRLFRKVHNLKESYFKCREALQES